MRTRSWGADGSRVYLPGYEHRTDTGETKVYVGDYAVISRTGSTRKVEYLLKDRLGSVDAVANASGAVIETRGYDAFGKPRDGSWNDLNPAKIASTAVTPKGFTQHEHLNQLELIHMNGRAYDYHLGRFTGVDPFIQFPLNSQSLNPYSYLMNSPLSGTDPTGYCSSDAGTGSHIVTACVNVTANMSDGSSKNLGNYNPNSSGDMAAASKVALPGVRSNASSGSNGGTRQQLATGSEGRQNQAATPSEKNSATNTRSASKNHAEATAADLSSMGVRLTASGSDDDLPFTNSEPKALVQLKKKYPELIRRMDISWRSSFGSNRKEYTVIAFENPEGTEMRFLEYSARRRYTPGLWGYKDVSRTPSEFVALLAKAGIPDDWTIRVMFHTHPFNKCFGLFSCAFNSEAGPEKGPSEADWETARKYEPSIIHVVREIDEANYTPENRAHKDYYYGKSAGF
jgi:RHS repeat-associated protein